MSDTTLRPITECPYCELPIPVDSTEAPYCNRDCFNSHVNKALRSEKVDLVIEKIKRHATAPRHPKAHSIYCACHYC